MESFGLAKRTQNSSSALTSLEPAQPPFHRGPTESTRADSPLREYWHILIKRRWTILLVTAAAVALATFVSIRTTPQYDSSVRIAINREANNALGFKDSVPSNDSDDWDYTVALDTQITVLQSDALALQIIRSLHLDQKPAFAGSLAAQAAKPGIDSVANSTQVETQLLGRFRRALKVAKVPHTRLVEVHFLSPDPKLAAQVANAVATSYIERNFRDKFESTMQTSDWLSQQLKDLQVKVERSQQKLAEYQKANGILGLDEKQNIITQKLDQLNKELTAAEADRIQKESLDRLSAGKGEVTVETGTSSLVESLRAKEADLTAKRSELSTQFGPSYPKVREVDNQLKQVRLNIDAAMKQVAAKSHNDYLAAMQREQLLRKAFDQQKQLANELNQSAIEYNLLQRDVDTNRQLYEGLLQRLKEASIAAGLRSNNIRVVDPARIPLEPSKPNIPQNIAISLFLGLLGGVALAFVQESMDDTIRSPEEASLVSGLVSLGMVPLNSALTSQVGKKGKGSLSLPATAGDTLLSKAELISLNRPRSEVAEAYRSLRTSVLLTGMENPPKVILVTSSLPQEGKTTTSINSAIVLAQKGARVLLIDADMRRPGIHRSFNIPANRGLSTLLTGKATAAEVSFSIPQIPNLFVMPAGAIPPNPAELLSSRAMSDSILRWREEFDHVVIDTPPMLSVTDAVMLSVQVDSVVLIVRSGKTSKQALRRSRELLRRVNASVSGVVLNAVDLESPDYSYYYYGNYRKYYGKGYYTDNDSSS